METSQDLSSPSDWLTTSLPHFSALDNALRCQICKDFYSTPMLTSCAHTFCSKCIRTCLSGDGKCPTCRTADQASKLRNNFAVEEAVMGFVGARKTAFEIASRDREDKKGEGREGGGRPGKRRRVSYEDGNGSVNGSVYGNGDTERRQTRSMRSRGTTNAASPISTQMDGAVEIMDTDEEDGTFEPEDGLVACPICSTRMLEKQVDPHIGSGECDGTKKDDKTSRAPVKAKITAPTPPPRPQSAKPQERLAELNYSMLTENALRKKIAQLGLPTVGSKILLKERHTEWVNLWNANCDSRNPKTKSELLAELRKWEKAQGAQAKTADGVGIMEKDFDAVGWQKNNQDDFTRLILEAKKKRDQARAAKTEKDTTENVTPVSNGEKMTEPHDTTTTEAQTQHSHPPPPSLPKQSSQENPYENNPEAISSIRAKVDALNNGIHIEPLMNQGFARSPPPPPPTTAATSTHNRRSSLSQQSPIFSELDQPSFLARQSSAGSNADARKTSSVGSAGMETMSGIEREGKGQRRSGTAVTGGCSVPAMHKESSIGEHFADVPDRRMNMFRVPEDPVSDNEKMM